MTILVIGGNSFNKGAQLMLVAVAEAVEKYFGQDIKLVVSPLCGKREWLKRKGYGLLNVPLPLMGSIFAAPFLLCILEVISAWLPGNRLRSVSFVFDISGFAFSDQFGLRPLRNFDFFTERLSEKGVPFVLLPQAFGPFDKPDMKRLMKRVIDRSERVYARDLQSFEYLKTGVDSAKSMKLMPDITVGVSASAEQVEDTGNYCCIVPNCRMLDQGQDAWGDHYETILLQVAEYLGTVEGKDLLVLVHDAGGRDMAMARSLQRKSSVPLQVCSIGDPQELKRVISKSDLVVGSRFHALVSALSSGVPAIAFGWSHKYAEIFGEYGQADYVFTLPGQFEIAVLSQLLDPALRNAWLERNRAVNESKQNQVDDMWLELKTLVASCDVASNAL